MVNNMKRLITGLSLISIMFGIMILDYYFVYGAYSIFPEGSKVVPIFSDILVWGLLGISIFEMYRCYKSAGYNLFKTPLIILGIAIYPVFFLLEYFRNLGVLGVVIVLAFVLVVELIMFTLSDKEKYKINDLFAEMAIFLYPVFLLSLAFILSSMTSGIYVVMFATFLAVAGDTFAYWFGKSLHKKFPKKMCPTISPKKTVVGAIGGIIGSIFAAMVFWAFFEVGGISQTANMLFAIRLCSMIFIVIV